LHRSELQVAWHADRFGRGGVHLGQFDIQAIHPWVSFAREENIGSQQERAIPNVEGDQIEELSENYVCIVLSNIIQINDI
jgi:hypothetical protein